MGELNIIQNIAVWILPVLFAITAHEAAHGWIAYKLGDSTAKKLGRVSFNPIKHIDPVGTVIVPLALLWIASFMDGGGFVFGWAKPVPVNWANLRNPRRDMALVALAGPMSNLLMALFWIIVYKAGVVLSLEQGVTSAEYLRYIGFAGVMINMILMVVNLLPILPLDGGRVLHAFLPARWADSFGQLEPYGLFILLALLFTGLLQKIMAPILWVMGNLLGALM
ncbi:MAG: site-2 protease family protein [Gammaproteobacteria bacterium]|nr:site-2 protease family protein [Gammaproteobacteria bacterium]